MVTTKQHTSEAFDGGALAVCINDCQLDYGQSHSDLLRICFGVRCAFAEMRWGRAAAMAFESGTLVVDEHQPPQPNCV